MSVSWLADDKCKSQLANLGDFQHPAYTNLKRARIQNHTCLLQVYFLWKYRNSTVNGYLANIWKRSWRHTTTTFSEFIAQSEIMYDSCTVVRGIHDLNVKFINATAKFLFQMIKMSFRTIPQSVRDVQFHGTSWLGTKDTAAKEKVLILIGIMDKKPLWCNKTMEHQETSASWLSWLSEKGIGAPYHNSLWLKYCSPEIMYDSCTVIRALGVIIHSWRECTFSIFLFINQIQQL